MLFYTNTTFSGKAIVFDSPYQINWKRNLIVTMIQIFGHFLKLLLVDFQNACPPEPRLNFANIEINWHFKNMSNNVSFFTFCTKKAWQTCKLLHWELQEKRMETLQWQTVFQDWRSRKHSSHPKNNIIINGEKRAKKQIFCQSLENLKVKLKKLDDISINAFFILWKNC